MRAITTSLNDDHSAGEQTRFARLLAWDYSTLWRKLHGRSPIGRSDKLAIVQALAAFRCQRKTLSEKDLIAENGEFCCHLAVKF
jgi:hypothetical protein